ncbi:MAG TPA: NmrA family NAD(P)-binding protein [Kofleriaceae bacterium]|nr:NmrA family NAD(P)-binding protein [Kofleriaceae bacterium]
MTTTVLLFGASGNIGGHTAAALAQHPDVAIRVAVRPNSEANLDRLRRLGVEIVRADLGDPASLEAAFAGVDRAFLINSLFALDEMAAHTANFLAAARKAGVKRIVRSGGAPFPSCPIADLHHAAQAAFCDAGIPWVLVRPNFYDSNLLWSAATIKDHGAYYLPIGGARIAWTDPADIGAVVAHALLADGVEGKTFHVTGPEAVDGHVVADVLTSAIATARHDRNALTARQFDAIDTDGDGRISRAELGAYLGQHGFAPPEVDAILVAADRNGDGVISLDEFRADADRQKVLDAAPAPHVRFVPVDFDSARQGMASMGVPPRAVELLIGLYEKFQEGGAEALGHGVQEALGRAPRSVRDWAAEHVAAFVPTHWEGLKRHDEELRPSSLG